MNSEPTLQTSVMPTSPIHDLLRRSSFQAIRRLQVEEDEQDIILSGTLPSYHLKQLAQEMILPLLGRRKLRNCVVVIPPGSAAPNRGS